MSLYLKSKKLDHEAGSTLTVLMHAADAKELGVVHDQIIAFAYRDVHLYVHVEITDSYINAGELGLYEEIWDKYRIPNDEVVFTSVIDKPESIEYIKKKLLGETLNEDELAVIMKDIGTRKIREVEMAYFMATFFNPGFNQDEVLAMTKGMAASGEIMDWGDQLVVDKHSIGGVSAKGVTPILVPIIASHDLLIPNTSTRAITTPAGTSDILEVAMDVGFESDEVKAIVNRIGACMIWGGSLNLAPADDELIKVEKGLHIQSYEKILVSIVAKKIAMGIDKILIDIPYGPGTKVPTPEKMEMLSEKFINLFGEVGIECVIYPRMISAPDGLGIGPNLEMRDILRILNREESRPRMLEKTATEMAGKLLEIAGKAEVGKGYDLAMATLEDGRAHQKFWEIAMAQGADKELKGDMIQMGEYSYEVKMEGSGVIKLIEDDEVTKITRALGNPHIKEAGVYFEKTVGDSIENGELFFTLYATSKDRLEAGKKQIDMSKLVRV